MDWIRYRHKNNPKIEYDVAVPQSKGNRDSLQVYTGPTVTNPDEQCFCVRTVRNLLYYEEVHQPAFTYMPRQNFLKVYEQV